MACEEGVYKTLYDNSYKGALEKKNPLFDITSGTSAGEINATLIVGHVLENDDKTKPWDRSPEKLCVFLEEEIITDTWQHNLILEVHALATRQRNNKKKTKRKFNRIPTFWLLT